MKSLLLHSLWLIMMFETSKRVPYAQNCDCSFLIIVKNSNNIIVLSRPFGKLME